MDPADPHVYALLRELAGEYSLIHKEKERHSITCRIGAPSKTCGSTDPHVYALLRELAGDYFPSKLVSRSVGFRHPASLVVLSRFAFLLGTDLVNELV